jgi:hypothetical protein
VACRLSGCANTSGHGPAWGPGVVANRPAAGTGTEQWAQSSGNHCTLPVPGPQCTALAVLMTIGPDKAGATAPARFLFVFLTAGLPLAVHLWSGYWQDPCFALLCFALTFTSHGALSIPPMVRSCCWCLAGLDEELAHDHDGERDGWEGGGGGLARLTEDMCR